MLRTAALILVAAAVATGCSSEAPSDDLGGGEAAPGAPAGEADTGPAVDVQAIENALSVRTLDYSAALRTASLKLVRRLPTLEQIRKVQRAEDQRAAYEEELDAMLADVRFQERMIKWWKDTMRQGGGASDGAPSRDTAPVFAARVVLEGRPYTDLFTAASNTCPSYDGDADVFVDGDCDNGVPTHAGVLTNPGVMHQFYGNMAFRRVRWLQEIFVCTKFPAEYTPLPETKGGSDYVSPWPFESVSTAPVDFQDSKSVLCANCHTTMNHIAPLFAGFDANGQHRDTIQVLTPGVPEAVPTELSHWLRDGEVTSWRFGEPVADLPALGQAVAADPDVAECLVARFWNFAMSKEDIVTDLATVPPSVLEPYSAELAESGGDLKKMLREMFTSEDFVRF
jgi:hypothetical protein